MKRCGIYLFFLWIGALGWSYDWSTNPGDGSAENPYQVSDPNHLIALGTDQAISTGNYHFMLTNDITFDPDTDPNHLFAEAVIDSFNGTLDGRGYLIENLSIISTKEKMSHVGLFGTIEETGIIRNTGLYNVVIRMPGLATPSDNIGAICGENNGLIERSMVQGIVRGTLIMGGLVGANYGTIDDCYMVGLVDGSASLGGICGFNGGFNDRTGIIRRCHSSTLINTTGFTHGALVGKYFGGQLTDSAWDSDVAEVTVAYTLDASSDGEGIERIHKYTSAKMMQKTNFSFLDFAGDLTDGDEEIWRMCTDGVSPPRLGWEFFTRGDYTCPDGTALEDFGMLSSCFLAFMNIDAELDDDDDQIVNLNELARIGMYWFQTECGCPGADLTGDGKVSVEDLAEIIDVWLAVQRPECIVADMNHDGVIDLADVVQFTHYWLD